MKNNNKGFSLIELSIVLIIMGLLVAGITGGASLIKSAELRSFMSELRNYQTAVNAYYTSVGSLPGTTTGQIAFGKSCDAWAAMSKEGTVDVTLNSFATSGENCSTESITAISSSNSPTAKLKGAFYAIGYNNNAADNVIFVAADAETVSALTAAVPATTSSAGTAVTKAALTRKEAKLVDDKMDNGISDSGKVRAYTAGTVSESGGAHCKFGDAESTKDCAISYAIGL